MSPIRWFMVWLLALALPVQGFAASAMQHCRPGQDAAHHAAALALAPSAAVLHWLEMPSPSPAVASEDLATSSEAAGHPNHAQHAQHAQHAHDRSVGMEPSTQAGASLAAKAPDRPAESDGASASAAGLDHRCSACAACCAAFALPARLSVQVVEAVRVFGNLGPAADAPPFLTSGPERPPRVAAV